MSKITNSENNMKTEDKKAKSIYVNGIEIPMIECDNEVLHYEAPEEKLPDVKWAEL